MSEPVDRKFDGKFGHLPLDITVSVGRARPTLKQLMTLSDDSVFPLDRSIDDPVELFIGDRLIAKGVLEEIGDPGNGRLGVRLTEIAALPGAEEAT